MVKCDVIQDLLPLYIDDAASEGSRSAVDEHIKICANCREALTEMQDCGSPIRLDVDKAEIQAFKIMKRKLLRKNLIIACASVVATIIIFSFLGFLFYIETQARFMDVTWIAIIINSLFLLLVISSIALPLYYYNRKKTRIVNDAPTSEAEVLIKSKAQEFLSWYGPKCYVTFGFINSPDIIRLRLPQEKFDTLSEGDIGVLQYKVTAEKELAYVDFCSAKNA